MSIQKRVELCQCAADNSKTMTIFPLVILSLSPHISLSFFLSFLIPFLMNLIVSTFSLDYNFHAIYVTVCYTFFHVLHLLHQTNFSTCSSHTLLFIAKPSRRTHLSLDGGHPRGRSKDREPFITFPSPNFSSVVKGWVSL